MYLTDFIRESKAVVQEEMEKVDFKHDLSAFMQTGQRPLRLSYVCIAANAVPVRY